MGAMENRQAIDFAYTVLFSAIYDQAFRTSWMPIRADFRPFSDAGHGLLSAVRIRIELRHHLLGLIQKQ